MEGWKDEAAGTFGVKLFNNRTLIKTYEYGGSMGTGLEGSVFKEVNGTASVVMLDVTAPLDSTLTLLLSESSSFSRVRCSPIAGKRLSRLQM